MKSNLICMLITIVAYLILMIVVGILASKKNKDTSDFYLGGRKLGPIVTAMSTLRRRTASSPASTTRI